MSPTSIIICLALAFFFGGIATFVFMKDVFPVLLPQTAVSSAMPEGPRIVVNVPTDWKPMEPLPADQTINGARAQLWWSVYQETIKTDYEDSNNATDAANAAVQACFP